MDSHRANANLRTGVVDEIAASEHGAEFEHFLEQGIEAVGPPLYARTVYCRRLKAYRVKRPSLVKAFGAGAQRRDVRGDAPPPSREYASPRNQPAWSPDPYERLANLIRASLIRDAGARGEPCKEDDSARISCRVNPQTGLIELFNVLENGEG